MSSVEDPSLIKELLKFVLDGARDHDVVPFFEALAKNKAARRPLADFTLEYFDVVGLLIESYN